MLIDVVARRFLQFKSLSGGQTSVRGTACESLAVAQTEPSRFEMTRAGARFDVGFLSTVTGIAPVQAIPTTAAQWLLMNNAKTKIVSLDEIGVVLVSGTAGAGIVVLGGLVSLGTLPTTVPSASAAGIKITPRHDGSLSPSKSSALVCASAQTLAAAPNGGWRVLAKSDSANTAVLSVAAIERNMEGSLVIGPGQGLAIVVVSPAGITPLFVPHCVYAEFDTDLEQ